MFILAVLNECTNLGFPSFLLYLATSNSIAYSKNINAKKLLNRNCALDISFSSNTVFKSFIESIKFLLSNSFSISCTFLICLVSKDASLEIFTF